MSEYQYYEFQAIDEPLDKRQMAELRDISTRATITPMSFTNSYDWGELNADPVKLLDKYFDVFFYFANWGTRILMFRLPKGALDLGTIKCYSDKIALTIKATKKHILVGFDSDNDSGDFEEEPTLEPLLSLREDLLRGDYRCLYIGWLQAVQNGLVKSNMTEPPLPPGLRKVSPPLMALVEYLRVDPDLLTVAAESSSELDDTLSRDNGVHEWVKLLPSERKNEIIASIVGGDANTVHRQLVKEYRTRERQRILLPQIGKKSGKELLADAAARSGSR